MGILLLDKNIIKNIYFPHRLKSGGVFCFISECEGNWEPTCFGYRNYAGSSPVTPTNIVMMSSLKTKWQNKKVNAKKENIDFNLTFKDFCDLADKVGISFKDMNINGYHLARYNDSGAYEVDNCRFIPAKENFAERKTTDKVRASGRKNMLEIHASPKYKEYMEKAVFMGKQWRKSLTEEEKHRRANPLKEEVVEERHKVIRKFIGQKKAIQKASLEIGITEQALRRFIKAYPLAL